MYRLATKCTTKKRS